jgi:hypothetical protein
MNKTFFVFVAMLFVSSVCFAQQAPIAPKHVTAMATANKGVIVTIQSVSLGDAAKNLKPEIVVADSMNKERKIVVMPATVILDKEGKAVSLDKLTKGEKIHLMYTVTKEGIKEALTIKIQG